MISRYNLWNSASSDIFQQWIPFINWTSSPGLGGHFGVTSMGRLQGLVRPVWDHSPRYWLIYLVMHGFNQWQLGFQYHHKYPFATLNGDGPEKPRSPQGCWHSLKRLWVHPWIILLASDHFPLIELIVEELLWASDIGYVQYVQHHKTGWVMWVWMLYKFGRDSDIG